jgi:hypothetical protein
MGVLEALRTPYQNLLKRISCNQEQWKENNLNKYQFALACFLKDIEPRLWKLGLVQHKHVIITRFLQNIPLLKKESSAQGLVR